MANDIFNQCLIAGTPTSGETGQKIDVLNPLDGSVVSQVPDLSDAEVTHTIECAHTAFQEWRHTEPQQRRTILRKWNDLLLANKEDIADLIVREQGKPRAEALWEVGYSSSYIDFYADETIRINGETIPAAFPQAEVTVDYEPVGVVGIITPWNFPIAMFLRKVAAALAAGCTCVVKPDEHTPLSAFLAIKLGHEAGIPPGVLNCIMGDGPMIGRAFCAHPKVSKISFTGSVAVGKVLARQAADSLKKVTLELGGDAPFIVFDDADLDGAVNGLLAVKFRNAGQTCVCANRVLVHKPIEQAFTEKLITAMSSMKLGSGLEEGVQIGPMIHEAALSRSLQICADAIAEGATLLAGGNRASSYSTIMEPTILGNVSPDMTIANQELFAPITPLMTFETEEEAVALANDTPFGLASYFYAENAKRIFRVRKALQYGMVGINTGILSSALAPFGGIKESGYGREGGRHGLFEYLNIKYAHTSHL